MGYFRNIILTLASSMVIAASALPNQAPQYLPVLKQEIVSYWPEQSPHEWLAALIEQESNWKLNATLKTSREFGCGLGQFTIAYAKDGSVRFDALTETKRLDKSLANWSWRDCYNAQYQLRAVVLKNKINYRQCSPLMQDERNKNACAAAAYNGGFGSVTKRIRKCQADKTCNANVWFGNVNTKPAQSTKKVEGYGESFDSINSKYPSRVEERMPKYKGKL